MYENWNYLQFINNCRKYVILSYSSWMNWSELSSTCILNIYMLERKIRNLHKLKCARICDKLLSVSHFPKPLNLQSFTGTAISTPISKGSKAYVLEVSRSTRCCSRWKIRVFLDFREEINIRSSKLITNVFNKTLNGITQSRFFKRTF